MPQFFKGTRLGWSNMTVNILGRNVLGISAVNYSDEQEKENLYGAGSLPVARGLGNVKTEASITLAIEEVEALQNIAPNGNLRELPPFDIIVQFKDKISNKIVTDVIKYCEFTNNKRDIKQGDKTIDVEFKLAVAFIEWGKK